MGDVAIWEGKFTFLFFIRRLLTCMSVEMHIKDMEYLEGKKKPKSVSIRLPESVWNCLQKIADREKVPLAYVARIAFEKLIVEDQHNNELIVKASQTPKET